MDGLNEAPVAAAVLQDFDDPTFDPFINDGRAHGDNLDPYPKYHELRETGPVHPFSIRSVFTQERDQATVGRPFISIVGHEAVLKATLDTETFSNVANALTIGLSFGETLTAMDAPEHTRYRRIFQRAFLPNTVRSWSEHLVQPVVAGLIDKFIDRGRADLVSEFTLRYPFQVIYRQLRLPPQDEALFQKLAVAQTSYSYAPDKAIEAGRKLGDYFVQMVRGRREAPSDDLPSLLATAEVDGERLPESVVVSFLRQLMNAGGDTTYRGTGTLLMALLQNPDQLEAVRNDRSLIPQAIEEALRWDGPVAVLTRNVTRDVEFEGHHLEAGTLVHIAQCTANRDPAVYPDPDRFDIFREQKKHLGFATGPHVCIGQHLARVEMERALTNLLDRLPNLRLDPDMPAPESRGYMLRTPRHIHVRFD